MNPLISVIVPMYNVEKYLSTCLDSILHQTYTNLEVIMMNDGTKDNSAQIAQTYVEKDSRFHLYSQPNQGLSAARNNALPYATGEFVSFVDSDDFLALDYYKTLVQEIQEADLVQFGYTRVDTEGKIIAPAYPLNKYQFVSAWSKLYRLDYLRKHNLHFEVGQLYEDILFSLDLWKTNPRIRKINYAGYYYRQQPHSITAQKHDTKPLFALIAKKKAGSKLWLRIIILYTTLRLRAHFLLDQ